MANTDINSAAPKPHLLLDDILAASATTSSTPGKYLASECYFIIECRICYNLFRSVTTFVAHKEKTCIKFASSALNADNPPAKDMIVCQPCEREFVSLALKQRHDEYFHSVNSPVKKAPPPESDLRSKLLETLPKSNNSVNSASSGMQCQQCTKWFPTADTLKTHLNSDCPNMAIQTDKQSLVEDSSVSGSGKSEINKNNKLAKRSQIDKLTRSHQQVFNCDHCHRMYSDKASLQKHVDVFHQELKTQSKIQSQENAKSASKRQRSLLENQENTRPGKQFKGDHGDKNADDISIYCDEQALQCLICLAQLESVVKLREHIKVEHSSSSNVNSETELQYEWGDSNKNDFSSVGGNDSNKNLECSVCGKKFKTKTDYDYHITLPHKISIRK